LATAYAIVSKHGGHLSVQSTDRQGSVFIVDLPASQASPAPAPEVVSPRLRTGAGRLLIMDDEESLRTLMVEALTRLGYDVHGAGDGAEAIDLYEAAKGAGRPFDAVLLDLTVRSGMGGVEAARRLKESDPSVRLIASSGYSDAPVMSRFREYGFNEVLPKPWAVAQLSEVVRRVIAQAADDNIPETRTAGVRLSDAPPDGTLP